jgi:hypothetical protein
MAVVSGKTRVSSIGRKALGAITRNATTVRRTCAESILTHIVGSDSGSSKCSRNTSKAATLAAYTVERETPEERQPRYPTAVFLSCERFCDTLNLLGSR